MTHFFYSISLVCIIFLSGCSSGSEAESSMPVTATSREIAVNDTPANQEQNTKSTLPKRFGKRLEIAWIGEGELRVPESVIYSPKDQIIFVANVGRYPGVKDRNGYISRIDARTGEVLTPFWFTDLHSPQGMAIKDGVMYIADVDQLVAVDIQTASLIQRYPTADSALLFNDVAIDAKSRIYVTDSRTHTIFRLSGNKLEAWVKNEAVFIPNGLCIQGQELLVGVDGKVLSIDVESKDMKVFIPNTGTDRAIDGLAPDGMGNFFISDWEGSTFVIHQDHGPVKILDGSIEGINACDLDFIPEQSLLIIPTSRDNRVLAYSWNPEAS